MTLGTNNNHSIDVEDLNQTINKQSESSIINNYEPQDNLGSSKSDDVERWALLFDINIFPGVITTIADCLQHRGWKPDHIKTVYSSSYQEVKDAFNWLIDFADENDIILICSNHHGSNGYIVLEDKNLYYETIDQWLDQCKTINIFYSISACHSGSAIPILGEEGRVIVTACEENESGSTLAFLVFLYPESDKVKNPIYFRAPDPNGAFARPDLDYNKNGYISIEEAFPYAKKWTEKWHNDFLNPDNPIHPLIYDGHKGEFDITECDLTPSPFIPIISGMREILMGEIYNFYVVTKDVDSGDLWYQFDWGDRIISDWIGPYKSNRIQTFSHMWGTRHSNYIKVRTKDSDNLITPWAIFEVELLEYSIDQYQVEETNAMLSCYLFTWAQSFVPSRDRLTRVDLKLSRFGNITSDITVSIRKQLDGNDLMSCSLPYENIPSNISEWITFDVPDISLNPGENYYLVLSTEGGFNFSGNYLWFDNNNSESYSDGEIWIHWVDTNEWEQWNPSMDSCFKTFFSNICPPGMNGPIAGEIEE